MAISKSAKIQAEIEKVTAKITEQQARLKELEQKKLEAENCEIVDIVRGMSVSLSELPVLLQQLTYEAPPLALSSGVLCPICLTNLHLVLYKPGVLCCTKRASPVSRLS